MIEPARTKQMIQTDVGMIPQDWNVVKQKEVVKYINGRAYSKHEWETRGVPVVRLQNLTQKGGEFYYSNLQLPEKQYMYKGDLIFMWSASFGPYIWWGDKAIYHYHIWKIECNTELVDKTFYYYKLLEITEYLKKGTSGSTMLHLTKGGMEQFKIALPPTNAEQTAIANALSDMDDLIEGLEKLIEKKKRIKEGVMQELLKPKEGWKVFRVSQLGNIFGGLSGKSKQDFGEGNALYIPFLNVMNNVSVDSTYLDKVRVRSGESQNEVRKGDLIFNGSSETPDELGLCSVVEFEASGLYLNSFCFGLRLKDMKEYNGLFLAYFFRSHYGRQILTALAQGSTRYNLSKSNFKSTRFSLPNPKEQVIIASVLRDLDNDLFNLQKQVEKLIFIKEGMMQDLLTGKKRLI